jgi:hypothetical protein
MWFKNKARWQFLAGGEKGQFSVAQEFRVVKMYGAFDLETFQAVLHRRSEIIHPGARPAFWESSPDVLISGR